MSTTENDPPADDQAADDQAGDEPVADAPAAEDTSAAEDAPAADAVATDVPAPDGGEPLALEAPVDAEREALQTRGILPIALPILSVIALAAVVINLSRAFLAGGSDGALIIGIVAIFTIMGVAAFLSAAPKLRTSSLVMITSSVLVVVISAGLISLGPSEEHEGAEGGFQEPKGKPVATVEVDALPSLKFQAKEFTTKPGINLIKYVDKGGSHTLVFSEPEFAGFLLKVPPDDEAKVELKPGKYTIFCTIPGHRPAGMEATITVK